MVVEAVVQVMAAVVVVVVAWTYAWYRRERCVRCARGGGACMCVRSKTEWDSYPDAAAAL